MPDLPPLPDACHVKRSQARDLAVGIEILMRSITRPRLWLYIRPNGDVVYELGKPMDGDWEQSLVGVYTRESTAKQIENDILAMEREPIAP